MGVSGKATNLRWLVLLLCFGAVLARHWPAKGESQAGPAVRVSEGGPLQVLTFEGVRFSGDMFEALGRVKPPEVAETRRVELCTRIDEPSNFSGAGFRMKRVLRWGMIVGMRVHVPSNHPLELLGIQDGDIIMNLNGMPINGPEALSNIYSVLRRTSALIFLLERQGRQTIVEVELEPAPTP